MPKRHSGYCENCREWYNNRSSPDYCSWKCYRESRWTNIICHMCGDTKKVRVRKDGRGMKFCSYKCAQRFSRVQEGRYYKGRRYVVGVQGYFVASNGSGDLLHRDIWADHNGQVPSDVIIHHKNGDRLDNRLENLELMEWGEHTRHHNLQRAECSMS